jgi:hypothetical protein
MILTHYFEIMKIRKRIVLIFNRARHWGGQKGQTLVEFVLLLAVISSLSYAFVAVINRNIGSYWEDAVNLVIHDEPGGTTAKID